MIDYLGYGASLAVLISMLMKDMTKFRVVNTLACSMFVIYGIIRRDNPIILLNSLVIIINLVYLFKGNNKI